MDVDSALSSAVPTTSPEARQLIDRKPPIANRQPENTSSARRGIVAITGRTAFCLIAVGRTLPVTVRDPICLPATMVTAGSSVAHSAVRLPGTALRQQRRLRAPAN